MKSEDVDLRVAAGETLALLFEIIREVEQEEFTLEGYSGYIDIDDMLDTLYELVQDKSRQRAKKDKLKQKSPFKDIVNSIEVKHKFYEKKS